ncbi:type III secretion HpaP family protein [Hahella ganghwensis]|uniref:type III secretion HpaP family protein n=1 Tax=Hahella ganghwensis TaxID=286420 RepID=UPI000367E676|nr:type III secretion HpaP family protein [Hahella ganghwensis]
MNSRSLPQTSSYSHSLTEDSRTSRASRQTHESIKKEPENQRSKASPNESELQRFQQLLGQTGQKENTTQEPAVLQHAHGYLPSLEHRVGHNPVTASRASTEELAELVSRLVDKMWVKSSEGQQMQEIRMDLKNFQLPETELRITRADGILNIQFATAAAASYQQLASNRSHLLQLLQRRYAANGVNIKVSVQGLNPDGDIDGNTDLTTFDVNAEEPESIRKEIDLRERLPNVSSEVS